MGILLLERAISLFDHKCLKCNTVVMKDDDVIVTTIETVRGDCIGSTHAVNEYEVKTPKYGTYTAYSTVNMYDYDSTEYMENSLSVVEVHCKTCLFFLGWKHNSLFMFLKKRLTSGIN